MPGTIWPQILEKLHFDAEFQFFKYIMYWADAKWLEY